MDSKKDPLIQLQNTGLAISRLFGNLLDKIKGFKFLEALKITSVRLRKEGEIITKTDYFE